MYTDTTKNTKVTKFDYKVIAVLVVISLIIFYFLVLKDALKDKNIKLEEEMIEKAKDYVLNNNISTTKEIYLDTSKLNITLDDRCSFTSGVIFDGVNYIPNLICSDYKSVVISSNQEIKEFIELKGDEVILLAKGLNFVDPGFISNDVVNVIGNIGTEEGLYNIYYKLQNNNKFAIRKVVILDNPKIRDLYPTISLNGQEIMYIVEGNNYNELGVVGNDSIDGDISSNVVINGKVDTNVPGEYTLNYILTNSRNYSNIITRKIIVLNRNSDLVVDYTKSPSNLTNEDVIIKLSISSDYNKIVYPDNTEGRDLTYTVKENGEYKFSIYDTYNRVIEKNIIIDNINRTIPEGTCVATLYYNRTSIDVNIKTAMEISSYEYIIDGKSLMTNQSNSYVSTVVKPNEIKVKVKDSINNQNEIVCSKINKTTREIVTDAKGKNCLEGLTCYIQYHYQSSKYPYCSLQNNSNTCRGIGYSGCSITSVSNAIAAMGVKSKNGELYNPFTVWEELYPINKKTGQCNGGCSGWTRMKEAVEAAGLSTSKVDSINKSTIPTIIEHLKKGYPVVVWAEGKPFSSGSAHFLSLLGVNDENKVFLSDSANYNGTKKEYYKGKQYYVDTWVSTDDLITGNVKQYFLVGPAGMFGGK